MHLKEFERLVSIMHRLRKECPWDKKQTPATLRQYILEEAFETVETIDDENWDELKKELGDLLLQVVFQAEIAQEKKRFQLSEVIHHINEKLILRHPHIFSDTIVKNADDVKENWETIKLKTEKRTSILEGVPKALPALLRAQRLQDKASHVGFDWNNAKEVLLKVEEEINEIHSAETMEEQQAEMGDLLFTLANYCRHQGFNAEDALRGSTEKFISRFQYIEKKLAENNETMKNASLEQMDELWEEAKHLSKTK